MKYLDEEILKKRDLSKKEKYNSLNKGIYINGKINTFSHKTLFDTFSICLPDSMKLMPDEFSMIKYPSEFRPQIILTSMDLSINISFSDLPKEIETRNYKLICKRMKKAIQKVYLDIPISSIKSLNTVEGDWFSFRSHSMDCDLYNMMLVIIFGDEIIQSSFNCPYKESQNWEKIVLLIWNSIQELKREDI